LEEFIAEVRKDGRITIPKRFRDRFNIDNGSYVHMAIFEVHEKGKDGVWIKQILDH
jgi:AbrB family looped-hinge helix DNA binding protein